MEVPLSKPFYRDQALNQGLASLQRSEGMFNFSLNVKLGQFSILQAEGAAIAFRKEVFDVAKHAYVVKPSDLLAFGSFSAPIASGKWSYGSKTGLKISGSIWGLANLVVHDQDFHGREAGKLYQPGLAGVGLGYGYFEYTDKNISYVGFGFSPTSSYTYYHQSGVEQSMMTESGGSYAGFYLFHRF